MRDRAMVKLGLLFMVVSITAGVNYTVFAYNEMLGKPQAIRTLVIHQGSAGEMEIGLLGKHFAAPDPRVMAKTRIPELRGQLAAWQQNQIPAWRAMIAVWQHRLLIWQTQTTVRLRVWMDGPSEQKKRL